MSAPKKSMMIIIGKSQNFLRTRKNCQSSFKIPMIYSFLELIFEALRWRGALDKIALCFFVWLLLQDIARNDAEK